MPPFERRDPLTSQYHPIAYASSGGRENEGEIGRRVRDRKRERESRKEKKGRKGGKTEEIEGDAERKK